MSSNPIALTVAYGDGIGPEIMAATMRILDAAGAPLQPEIIEIGEKNYLAGHASGIGPEAWDSIKRTKILFKAPITTPQGKGYKSLNVTLRKSLGLYANVRPCRAFHPFIATHHPNLNCVIIRENEEDLYAGIEYRLTQDSYHCMKLITQAGCERIVRYAFEYARQFGRHTVTCMSKDNIMKMTDGIFHKVFDEIAPLYPEIKTNHYIIDIGTALLASQPERFDVVVTSNLYGDIISDVTAQVVGSVGLAGSSNIGKQYAMFEAIHGSAPDIAGKKIANPSGLINAAILMLAHLGLSEHAANLENAWLCTIEQGRHTQDIYSEKYSKKCLNTDEFADAVIKNLGKEPQVFAPSQLKVVEQCQLKATPLTKRPSIEKICQGVDIFLDLTPESVEKLGAMLQSFSGNALNLTAMSCRGIKIWPDGLTDITLSDLTQCRFEKKTPSSQITQSDIIALLEQFNSAKLNVVKVEVLFSFGDTLGYSLIHGQ